MSVQERNYRIGEVADRVGVTTRTIRYYEELGLLGGSASRSKGAHRLYGEPDVTRLKELVRLRDLLGLTLEELIALAEVEEARQVLRGRWDDDPSDAERMKIVKSAIPLVEHQLELVRTRQERLAEFSDELSDKLRRLRRRRTELERKVGGAQ